MTSSAPIEAGIGLQVEHSLELTHTIHTHHPGHTLPYCSISPSYDIHYHSICFEGCLKNREGIAFVSYANISAGGAFTRANPYYSQCEFHTHHSGHTLPYHTAAYHKGMQYTTICLFRGMAKIHRRICAICYHFPCNYEVLSFPKHF